jgi:hypothetical protein
MEDNHAIGDMDLLNNEALKGENRSNVLTFIITFAILGVSAIICCYLNYTFSATLSKYIFIMFAIAFAVDTLVFRNLWIALLTLIKFITASAKGYKAIEYDDTKKIQ